MEGITTLITAPIFGDNEHFFTNLKIEVILIWRAPGFDQSFFSYVD